MRKPKQMPLAFIPPMLPTLVEEPPEGDDWIHEIKYDGYRLQILLDRGTAQLFTRNGHDWTEKLKPLAEAADRLPAKSALLDGEMIVTNAEGKPDFHALRSAIRSDPGRLVFVAFDLLHLNGRDLRQVPIAERRVLLWSIVAPGTGRIQFSQDHAGEGDTFFRGAETMGLEGIVSKRADSTYVSGRTRAWLKTKCYAEATFDIIGVQREPGQPAMVLMADRGRYMGGAFVTLPRGIRERLWARVQAKAGASAPKGLRTEKAEWVKPGLRGRVKFLRGEEKLRHASLQEWSEE